MTCIVGVETEDGGVVLGGDSAASGNDYTLEASNQKAFFVEDRPMAVGYTSSFRMGQILKRDFEPPEVGPDKFKYVLKEVIPQIRSIMKEGGYSKIKSNREKSGLFLLAVEDKLFKVQGNFSVLDLAKPYTAIGSGFRHAYGSLHTTEGMDLDPKRRVELAISAAAETQDGVSLPIHTLRTHK